MCHLWSFVKYETPWMLVVLQKSVTLEYKLSIFILFCVTKLSSPVPKPSSTQFKDPIIPNGTGADTKIIVQSVQWEHPGTVCIFDQNPDFFCPPTFLPWLAIIWLGLVLEIPRTEKISWFQVLWPLNSLSMASYILEAVLRVPPTFLCLKSSSHH